MLPSFASDSSLLPQVLYKVCNSFVEMGSANVQATDYLKGVGQYLLPLGLALEVCLHWVAEYLSPTHQDRGSQVASFSSLLYGEMGP